MLTELRLQNYRCFDDATIPFGPLTVLVGPNGAGKSTVLRALGSTPPQASDRRAGSTGPVELVGTVDGAQITRTTQATNPLWPFEHQPINLSLDACRRTPSPNGQRRLAPDGTHLVNVVFNLPRKVQQAYSDRFCALVPAFQSVEPKGLGNSNIGLMFQDRWSDSTWYHAWDISDGSVLAAAYLLLPYQDPAPQLITIEEPERGLHPGLIGHVMHMIRELVASGIQVVLATQSPVVLDHVAPEEVVFLRRAPTSGAVVVQRAPTGHGGWAEYLAAFDDSLGAAWLSGGLGG